MTELLKRDFVFAALTWATQPICTFRSIRSAFEIAVQVCLVSALGVGLLDVQILESMPNLFLLYYQDHLQLNL